MSSSFKPPFLDEIVGTWENSRQAIVDCFESIAAQFSRTQGDLVAQTFAAEMSQSFRRQPINTATIYQAPSDGFIHGYAEIYNWLNGGGSVEIRTGTVSPPQTRLQLVNNTGASPSTAYVSICTPVPSGEYFKVSIFIAVPGNVTVHLWWTSCGTAGAIL